MKILTIKLVFLLSFLGIGVLKAQVFPPDFICVKNDTLIWENAVNGCGAFNAVEIFISNDRQGPYSLLARITDPNQRNFFHVNPGNQTWYFYLLSDHNCPGEPQLSSDTLDNRSPEIAPIRSVSVEGSNVRLRWQPSPSPEVNGYIIYRNTSIGTVPIDTVFGSTEFLDTNADPQNRSETYYVLALDPCGNTSLFDLPHSTIFQAASFSACRQEISLGWNPYENWPNGIGRQEIWLSVNGGPSTPIDTLAPGATAYVFENADDGNQYCFSVRAIEASVGFSATSNEVCLMPDLVQPVRELAIKNLSVSADNNTVDVTWVWSDDAELQSANLLHKDAGGTLIIVFGLDISPPLNSENTVSVTGFDAGSTLREFAIETRDQCDSVVSTSFARPVLLAAAPGPSGGNVLQWTPLEIPQVSVREYEILKQVNGNFTSLATVSGNVRTFSDNFAAGDQNNALACYRILAKGTFTRKNGVAMDITAASNSDCAAQASRLFVPNAFSPRGVNQTFKPVLSFNLIDHYTLQVFNRWGGLVFESRDPEKGWDGKKDGQDQPQGVYTYRIRFNQPDGKLEEKSGWVMLIR